jgi:hypothetical protein
MRDHKENMDSASSKYGGGYGASSMMSKTRGGEDHFRMPNNDEIESFQRQCKLVFYNPFLVSFHAIKELQKEFTNQHGTLNSKK